MKKRKASIKLKLYSIFAVSFIIPLIIISVGFSIYYYFLTLSHEQKNMEYILSSVDKSMEMQYRELVNISNIYYMHNDIFKEIESLNNPKLYQYYDDLMRNQLENEYSLMFTKTLHTAGQRIRDVVFFPINEENEMCYYLDKSSSMLQPVEYQNYHEEEWFRKTAAAAGEAIMLPNHVPEYASESNREEVYSLTKLIQDTVSKKNIGVIKIDIELQNLRDSVEIIPDKSQDGLFISDGTQILVKADNLPDSVNEDQDDGITRTGGKLYYQKSLQLSGSQWRLTYMFYMGELFSSLFYMFMAVILVAFAALCFAFVIYKSNSKSVIQDIGNITDVLKEVQKGNLQVSASVEGDNELQEITKAINEMISNLKEYINQKYVMVIKQQKAKYMALQSQINPHFLYNTLNGFIALNRMGEKKKLEKSIICLTHLFRYTCTKADTTTIQEELQFIREYLELEKLKYDERLEYIIWMDEGCSKITIPKLLFQPIVENSIIHGMGNLDEPIMITIVARCIETKGIGKVNVISIRDNGIGFNQKDESRERVGIDSVRTRMELYYTQSLCQVISEPGKGTKTTLVFKENKGEENDNFNSR